MSSAANVLHLRISRLLPLDLKRSLHPSELQRLCETAVENGWTDAEWLAGIALEGTAHPSVDSPAAVFATRLRSVATTKCPGTGNETALPAPIAEVRRANGCTDPVTDPARIRARVDACRRAIAR